MIKNVIFDIGNVIFKYNPGRIISEILPQTENHQKHLKCLMEGPLWDEMDSGRIEKENTFELLQSDYNYSDNEITEAEKIIDNFEFHLELDEGMKTLFEDLSDQFNIFIISNFQSQPFQKLLAAHPFLNKAKRIVISADVKLLKPNPRIYKYLIENEALDPKECLFIDDKKENVKAANKQKIQGIIHTSYDATIETLKEEFNISIR